MTKYARYLAHGEVAYGVVEGDVVKQITAAPYEDHQVTDHTHGISDVKLLSPVVPNKVVAIGLNYRSHLGDRVPPEWIGRGTLVEVHPLRRGRRCSSVETSRDGGRRRPRSKARKIGT